AEVEVSRPRESSAAGVSSSATSSTAPRRMAAIVARPGRRRSAMRCHQARCQRMEQLVALAVALLLAVHHRLVAAGELAEAAERAGRPRAQLAGIVADGLGRVQPQP